MGPVGLYPLITLIEERLCVLKARTARSSSSATVSLSVEKDLRTFSRKGFKVTRLSLYPELWLFSFVLRDA